MGVRLAAAVAATAIAATPVGFLQARQAPDGGFVEPGGSSGPQLTAWAVLGLKARARARAALSTISSPTRAS